MLNVAYQIGSKKAEQDVLTKLSGIRGMANAALLGGIGGAALSQLSQRQDGSMYLDPYKTDTGVIGDGVLAGAGSAGGYSLARLARGGLLGRALGIGIGGFAAPTVYRAAKRNVIDGY